MSRIRARRGRDDPASRSSRVDSVRSMLEREQFPRLQMLVIVLLTGAAGLIASALMLHFGLTSMAPRYLLALCIAYAVFLFILWLWLRSGGEAEIPDPGSDVGSSESGICGKGGSFDGGGASGDYQPGSPLSGLGDQAGGALDGVDVDVGDAGIPLAVLALMAGVVLCAGFVVYSAPTLIAELLVDGLLSASLYRRLRGIDQHHWLQTALRRTMWPFVFAAISVTSVGWALSWYAPGAHSIGQAIERRAS